MTSDAARERWIRLTDRHAGKFGFVLVLVIATYVLTSLIPYRGWDGVVIAALGVFTAFYALVTARARSRLLIAGGCIVVLVIVLAIASAALDRRSADGVAAMLMTLLFVLGAGAILRAVVTETRITAATIAGAISVYIMLSILYAFVYVGLDVLQTTPFFGKGTHVQRGDFLFFSMTTLTTTGYGDLVPAIQPGRMLAAMEMLNGQIFVVTLVARLVSGWQPGEWLRQGAGIARRFEHRDS